MGLVILAALFLLPFSTGSGAPTYYGTASPLFGSLSIQSAGDPSLITWTYVQIVALILLVIAGLVGVFPLGTGVLGVVAMAMLSVAPRLIYPNGQVTVSLGPGFIVLWIASIVSLGGSFWHGKKEAVVQQQPTPVAVSAVQPQAQTQTKVCPKCGAQNAADAMVCSACGAELRTGVLK